MNYKRFNRLTKEGMDEVLIVIKKLGLPFVILGGLFLLYSWMYGKPAISFSQLMITFLFLGLFQMAFENLWLEKEVDELKKRLSKLEEKYKFHENE